MCIAEIVAQMAEATTSAILIARSASLGARRMEINGTKPSITRDAACCPDVTVYHAGTAIKEGKLVTNGGRVLGVTATAATLPEALKKAYAASESIHFDKLHKRSDIGARALAAMQ